MVTGFPFKVSGFVGLADNTFPALALPIVPFPPAMASATASIAGAVTVIVTVAESQLLGFSFSQI